ncbi:MAG: 6,7-dimethyl-8-ribityllumazine synthase [Dissulfurimicrobium sp.]|uniref:6,7-dimethyl-8-ribityllumazine synthase n=3 Tax=Deltaproteobacteria incertae sedis TaxID=45456 RepID=UPI001EDC8810|nr:6,7-dimethyl-8-ribityllumazine synthase [Dissulfurimicrobium hydrothermale]UKL12846.1 6,7-dimethyl-8-ribityllumazine synthase [Dissulfurimicrobium hydrothermale]
MSVKTYEGHLDASGMHIGIVVARFNEFISSKLLSGAVDALVRHGAREDDIEIAWVPGAFEIPLAAKMFAASGRCDGVLCLGCIIRGATPHFEYVAAEASKGVAQVALQSDCPIGFGILTTDSIEQAIERAGTKSGNKGWDSALAVIEMVNLLRGFGV